VEKQNGDAKFYRNKETEINFIETKLKFLIFFLPCLSLIEHKNYNFGKWSQMMNKVNYFIFYEKNRAYVLHINSTDNTAQHITTINNVFLEGYFLLATYGVFHPIFNCNHSIKIVLEIN
jgi:hypothetical protein